MGEIPEQHLGCLQQMFCSYRRAWPTGPDPVLLLAQSAHGRIVCRAHAVQSVRRSFPGLLDTSQLSALAPGAVRVVLITDSNPPSLLEIERSALESDEEDDGDSASFDNSGFS